MANIQKSVIKISLGKEKLSAVQTFLERRNIKIEDEFEQFFETLFKKYVPKDVQIYIESTSQPTQTPKKKEQNLKPKPEQTNTDSDQNAEQISSENSSEIPLPYNRFEQFKD